MALVTDIADAVVAELAGGEFSQSFTPERRVLPEFELPDLKDLQVTVVPRGVEIRAATRGMSWYDVQVDVAVQRKIADADEDVPALCGLVEEIADFLRGWRFVEEPSAVWVSIVNEPVYSPEHLAEKRLFTSVLTVTYRLMK